MIPRQSSPDFLPEIQKRLEFKQSKLADDEKSKMPAMPATYDLAMYAPPSNLIMHPSQQFVERLMHPASPCERLFVKYAPGTGKTATAMKSALPEYLNLQIQRRDAGEETGRIFVIGFTENVFKNELMKFPKFGYVSAEEIARMDALIKKGPDGINALRELRTKIRRRLTDRSDRGFFEFLGYKALAIRLFPKINVDTISPQELLEGALSGKIAMDKELLARFDRQSLVICDEVHRAYNTEFRNQWGVALTVVLRKTSAKAMLLTATPLRTPTEIVELANIICAHPDPSVNKEFSKEQLFNSAGELKKGAMSALQDAFRGKVAFVHNPDPALYPTIKLMGEPFSVGGAAAAAGGELSKKNQSSKNLTLPDGTPIFGDLYVTKCPATALQRHAYSISARGQMGFDSAFLCDWVIPLPESALVTKKYPSAGISVSKPSGGKKSSSDDCEKWYLSCNSEELGKLGKNEDIRNCVEDQFQFTWNEAYGVLSGVNFFHRDNIRFYSSTYYAFILDIRATIQGTFDGPSSKSGSDAGAAAVASPQSGKMLVYHPVVRNSGVLAITELLLANGFVRAGEPGRPETLCVKCGRERRDHKRNFGGVLSKVAGESRSFTGIPLLPPCTEYTPARLVTIYADMDKASVGHALRSFNGKHNIDGSSISVCVGSRMLSESYDFKGLRAIFALKIDNMASGVQLFGRGIRKGSHFGLPENQRDITLYVYMICDILKSRESGVSAKGKSAVKGKSWFVDGATSPPAGISLSSDVFSQDEETILRKPSELSRFSNVERRYAIGLIRWNLVLELENKIFHPLAVDAAANAAINRPESRTSEHGIMSVMPYTPAVAMDDVVIRTTHDVYYSEATISLLKQLIKQAFSSMRTCWSYQALFEFVKNPVVSVGGKTKRLTLYNLTEIEERDFVSALDDLTYDTSDSESRQLLIHHSTAQMVKKGRASTYYERMSHSNDKQILRPDGSQGVIVQIGTNLFAMLAINKLGEPQFTPHSAVRHTATFVPTLIDIDAYQATLNPNTEFAINQQRFIEEWQAAGSCIDAKMKLCTCLFGIRFRARLLENAIAPGDSPVIPNGMTKSEFEKFNNDLISIFDRMNMVAYDYTVDDYKARIDRYLDDTTGPTGIIDYSNNKNNPSRTGAPIGIPVGAVLKRKKARAVGHWIGDNPRKFVDGMWKSIVAPIDDRPENDVIVGYLDLNAPGDIIPKFKIRAGTHQIEQHSDSRRVERGSVCQSHPRSYLNEIAKKIGIKISDNSVLGTCNALMRSLMYNEKIRKDGLRWWYFADEEHGF